MREELYLLRTTVSSSLCASRTPDCRVITRNVNVRWLYWQDCTRGLALLPGVTAPLFATSHSVQIEERIITRTKPFGVCAVCVRLHVTTVLLLDRPQASSCGRLSADCKRSLTPQTRSGRINILDCLHSEFGL